ncbi:MAG: bifunctional methylenetetrahydrofolate dehydrogenase/methenyltetrahydrofolate cyclohydrolase FolD [Clostridia bacterium]|nr:bifunctional methylenetetrahydrofolate dehydrogenase/methenyltetrahydrofolate cyclohydrolase FolD [Clostridia bacterium]
MPAELIDGKLVSALWLDKLAERVRSLEARGVRPHLAVVLVGEDEASQIYVRNKERACERIGIASTVIRLPADAGQQALEDRVRALNADPAVHGILVQLPLPGPLQEEPILALIDPDKDVDGFHAVNMGRLFGGMPALVPCTPKGCMALLEHYGIPLSGKEAVVVGRSNIVGKPMAVLLTQANATVTVCHSRTRDLAAHCRRADILVAAIGRPRFITADMIKPGATVIDVGINRVDGKVVGDVDFDAAREVAGAITPVPGGVGRMTIAMLLSNTLDAAERSLS